MLLMTATVVPPSKAPSGIIPHAKNRYTLLTRPSRCGGMIDWRRLTVITFHVAPSVVPIAHSNITTGHHDDSPTSTDVAALDPSVIARHVPLPSRFDIQGARLLPIAAPPAMPNPMIVNTNGPTLRISWANRTSTAPLSVDARFIRPRMMAIERSKSLAHSQRKPSASSVFHGF
jgi:hypothetical protein